METELSDVREQLSEKKLHLDELSKTIIKREDELTAALTRCDEEAVARAQVGMARSLGRRLTFEDHDYDHDHDHDRNMDDREHDHH